MSGVPSRAESTAPWSCSLFSPGDRIVIQGRNLATVESTEAKGSILLAKLDSGAGWYRPSRVKLADALLLKRLSKSSV